MSFTPDASALRGLPLFERVSLRLLEDLVEYASQNRWWGDDGDTDPCTSRPLVQRMGLLRRDMPGGTRTQRDFRADWLESALGASFTLAHAFAGKKCAHLFEMLVGGRPCGAAPAPPRTHWLFLAKDPRFAQTGETSVAMDPVEAAGLLARALDRIAGDVGERGAVLSFGANGFSLQCWSGEHPLPPIAVAAASLPSYTATREPSVVYERVHQELWKALGVPEETIFHVVCVNPVSPLEVPAWWIARWRPDFHRLVYLTRPGGSLRPPGKLMRLLRRGAWDPDRADGPYFTSVVPTVVMPPTLESRRCAVLTKPCFVPDLKTLETEPLVDESRYYDANAPVERRSVDQRLRRDLCRIRFDPIFPLSQKPEITRTLDRWARAVTNRQVGVALSGGGATSAALVPFLEALQAEGIPIDVVAGFSGGAILGAYLATGKLADYLQWCRGLVLTGLTPATVLYSRAIETFIDCEFGGANLDELDVRFVPMTVELRTDGSSRKCAVIGGTVGEGVRVSGVALGVFSPAERRGTRYVDGGVAMGVPTEALPRYGADLAIACNSIVAPPTRLLQDMLPAPFGQCLRWMPVTSAICEHLTDRFADYWVGFLTMLREAARTGGRDAQVYYEVSSEETPFIDAFLWCRMRQISDTAAKGRKWQDELDRSADLWSTLRRSG